MNKIQEIMQCKANFVFLGQQWIYKSKVGEQNLFNHHTIVTWRRVIPGDPLIVDIYQILH